jgi:hypothetical protein
MNEVALILGDTFFETHTVDVKCKLVRLVICCNGKEMTLMLMKTSMAGGGKLNSVLIDRITNEQMVVVVRMEQH